MIASSTPSVAIVGAGPGGLAAAMLLASSGVRVTIFEAEMQVGGRTGQECVGEYRFDRGPTFFMMPYVLEEIFAATGRRLSDYVELRRLDPMYRLLLGRTDGDPLIIDTTQDLDRMAARFDEVRPGNGAGFLRFIQDNRRKLELMTPILRKPIRNWLDLISRDAMKCGPVLHPFRSVHDELKRYFSDPQLQLAMSFQSKYLGMSPYECPSIFTILPLIEYEYGIWHPIGGCHALTRAMAEAVTEMGGETRLGTPVEGLVFEGTRVRGIRTANGVDYFDHVVINADATWAMKHLIPERLRGRETDARIDQRRYSCSTFMMYLGVDGEVELPHHTIYASRTYEQNLADITNRGRLSSDPSVYICNPSRIDPTLAPAGKSSLYVLMPTPNTKADIDWAAEAGAARETVLGQIEDVFGVHDVRSRIEAEKIITPDDWRSMRINHGATFNLAHNLGQMLHRRPQHRLQGVDGVWMVGGGTHPGSGLPVIFLSSEITARLLCEELGVSCPLDRSIVPRVAHRMRDASSYAQSAVFKHETAGASTP